MWGRVVPSTGPVRDSAWDTMVVVPFMSALWYLCQAESDWFWNRWHAGCFRTCFGQRWKGIRYVEIVWRLTVDTRFITIIDDTIRFLTFLFYKGNMISAYFPIMYCLHAVIFIMYSLCFSSGYPVQVDDVKIQLFCPSVFLSVSVSLSLSVSPPACQSVSFSR